MAKSLRVAIAITVVSSVCSSVFAADLFQAPKSDVRTRWISPENPTGAKGSGGRANRGAKGAAFIVVKPGETAVLADIQGAGIIHRMWLSGSIPRSPRQRRLIRLEMYWDGAKRPAVACPVGDFFGLGLGLSLPFENALFSNPEGRSLQFTIPMPYRTAAKMLLVNESSEYAIVWYDINYSEVKQLEDDSLYFHASWRRELATELGRDFEVLPKVVGKGRFIGANFGVIGNPDYRGTWFGEGEVKVYLDGDDSLPTLVGTGTEDYIGTGWGQGEFRGRYNGSVMSNSQHDIYAFYRYHLDDPVFFHQDCRVTIQQIGNTATDRLCDMLAKGVQTRPLWLIDTHGESDGNITKQAPSIYLLLDRSDLPPFGDPKHPQGGVHFYRSDDVSATAYFYLDRPENSLPDLASAELRVKDMHDKVWSKVKTQP